MSTAADEDWLYPDPDETGPRPSLARASHRPATHECTDCDGQGRTLDAEYDEFGRTTKWVRCEGCSGVGHLVSCLRCLDCVTVPESEQNGGLCITCRIEGETMDADEARLAR